MTAVIVGAGCSPPQPLPIEYETEHLRIGADVGYPLCEGDLQSFERSIAFIEDDLGLELPQKVELYLWSGESWDARGSDECNFKYYVFGCYSYDDLRIHATTYSLEHEITHAIVDNPNLGWFFGEGIAEAYSGLVLPFGEIAPTANFDIDPESFDARTAAHFARWLREKWGGHKLGQLAVSSGEGMDRFEDIYGMTLAQAEAMYFEDAPSIYTPLNGCGAPEMARREFANGWGSQLELDCSHDDTRANALGLYSRRTLVVKEEGKYSFSTDGAWIGAYRCANGSVEDYAYDKEHRDEDIPPKYAGSPSPATRYFEGGVVHTVDLRPGRYQFSTGIEGHEPGEVAISVWASLSPGPAEQPGA